MRQRSKLVDRSAFSAHVAWTHPDGQVREGYAVERRAAPAPFETIAMLTPAELAYLVLLPEPDGTEFEIRVRAIPEVDGSRASNVLSLRRGLTPPGVRCATPVFLSGCLPIEGAFYLYFSNRSPAADSLELRRIATGSVAARLWTFPASTAEYHDSDLSQWVRGAAYQYSLTAIKGDLRSDPAGAMTPTLHVDQRVSSES